MKIIKKVTIKKTIIVKKIICRCCKRIISKGHWNRHIKSDGHFINQINQKCYIKD